MRLFVGIALSPEAAAALSGVRALLASSGPELRWSEPHGWHVTLQFLGEVTEPRAAMVAERLATVKADPVPVRIAELGFFERAGVFFAGVALTPELLALEQRVVAAMRACGFTPEPRRYNPHITLARAKGRGGARELAPLKKALERRPIDLAAKFVAEEFLLYESIPGPAGSRNEVKARFSLCAGNGEGPAHTTPAPE
ncbi:MAG TPA: RNA 2',3'-cyclic phosphodiesterase [Acidobacteriaceae bacterium]